MLAMTDDRIKELARQACGCETCTCALGCGKLYHGYHECRIRVQSEYNRDRIELALLTLRREERERAAGIAATWGECECGSADVCHEIERAILEGA